MESVPLSRSATPSSAAGENSVHAESTRLMSTSFEKNPKSLLLEFFQKRDGSPNFSTTSVSHAPQNPCFKCQLVCPAVTLRSGNQRKIPEMTFEGSYRTKKRAEQEAAIAALDFYSSHGLIATFTKPSTSSPSESVPSPPPSQTTVPSVVMAPMSVNHGSTYSSIYATHAHPQEMGAGMVLPVCAGMEWGVGIPTMNGYAHTMPDSGYLVGSMELSQTNGGRHAPYNVEQPDEHMSSNYELDNSDMDRRKAEILQCAYVPRLRELALECLEEAVLARQELLVANEDLTKNAEAAQRMQELAQSIIQNRRQYDTQ